MTTDPCSRQSRQLFEYARPFMTFMTSSEWARRTGGPSGAPIGAPPKYDFVTGNPYTMPIPELSRVLTRFTEPQSISWFGYRTSDQHARRAVAESLAKRVQVTCEPDDVHLTNGGFAALAVAFRAIADPGDEILINTPCFFFYESLIASAGAVPVRVAAKPPRFELDLAAIRAAITPRTRAILVNSPNNPGGRIYQPAELEALAGLLDEMSQRHGRRIFLVSDEAFNRIVYDDREFYSPTRFYPHSFLAYTYGKTLLAPGERLGYLAVPAAMPEADRVCFRDAITMVQIAGGWQFPNAVLQYAIRDLEPLIIDIAHLQDNRDRLARGLGEAGYEVNVSEGTFFMLVKSPWDDDVAFVQHLVDQQEIFVLPGSVAYIPGYFRMSLCVTTETVVGSLPGFAAARKAR